MTHRDRAGAPAGQRAGRREAAGDAGHRRGFPTPPPIRPHAGSPARPERRLPQCLWSGAFGQERVAWRCGTSQAMRDAVRKPWETAVPVAQANRQWAIRWGRRKASTMSRIARGFPPTRRIACPISMGHYQRSLVSGLPAVMPKKKKHFDTFLRCLDYRKVNSRSANRARSGRPLPQVVESLSLARSLPGRPA